MQTIPSEVWHMSGILPRDNGPRYMLNGLYFHEEQNKQRVAATDGKSLLVLTWPILMGQPVIEAFVSWDVCNLVHKTKANRREIEATVDQGNNLILKTRLGFDVHSKAMPEGFKFPDYRGFLRDFHDKKDAPSNGQDWFDPINLSRCLESVGQMQNYNGYFGFEFVFKKDGPNYFSGTVPGKVPILVEGCVMPLHPPSQH